MNPIEIITKKRDGGELSSDELKFLIQGYVEGLIPDYQISAFLMAVYFQGMTFEETVTLTEIMRDSGTVLDLTSILGIKVDKHSTGGVGDKVSLILAPLVASAGLVVPMISGRALVHTGGTLDKLEAIPGFRTNLNLTELKKQLEKIGVALIGQSENLCPADQKIYALRDATATVQSIPLITASILSKKLAEGIDALVLDVKAGNGAIFIEKEKAWELARMLVKTANRFNLKSTALITSMEQPLGQAVGNWLETKEAIETLKGQGPADLIDLTLTLGAQMLVLGNCAHNIAQGKSLLLEKLNSGQAFEKFLKLVELQGG
ncbi:MAG: thymidine phosphorylase, partial [bacterium]